VCADGWDARDATVVCQEENLGTSGIAIHVTYNQTETLWLSGVDCVGNESQLSLCPHNGIGMVDDCTAVAKVDCFGKAYVFSAIMYIYVYMHNYCRTLTNNQLSYISEL